MLVPSPDIAPIALREEILADPQIDPHAARLDHHGSHDSPLCQKGGFDLLPKLCLVLAVIPLTKRRPVSCIEITVRKTVRRVASGTVAVVPDSVSQQARATAAISHCETRGVMSRLRTTRCASRPTTRLSARPLLRPRPKRPSPVMWRTMETGIGLAVRVADPIRRPSAIGQRSLDRQRDFGCFDSTSPAALWPVRWCR